MMVLNSAQRYRALTYARQGVSTLKINQLNYITY